VSNQVYANGMEVACKAAAGKSICAFPDVCFTPPLTPATPPGVPIPYPNTGMASDTSDGSTSVKISNQEVMLKNKSYFKKSTGDEAGSAPKKGVITSQITGKVYFNAWSMDVKVEGENVVRNLDLTTHNHASFPGDTPGWPYIDKADLKPGGDCYGVDKAYALTPYGDGCKGGKTPHHVIPDRQMYHGTGSKRFSNYTHGSAPCVCVDGVNQYEDEHGQYHAVVDAAEYETFVNDSSFTYTEAKEGALDSVSTVNDLDEKKKATQQIMKCVEKQLDNYYKERCNASDTSPLRKSGRRGKNVPKPPKKLKTRARRG